MITSLQLQPKTAAPSASSAVPAATNENTIQESKEVEASCDHQPKGKEEKEQEGEDSKQQEGEDPEQQEGEDPEQQEGEDPKQREAEDPVQREVKDPEQQAGKDLNDVPVKGEKVEQ